LLSDFALILNRQKIGQYTEIFERGGKLKAQLYEGRIPDYKFRIGGEEQEDLTSDFRVIYDGRRSDLHESIPFP